MADRFPLILNTSASQIQEIASGDQLDLTGNNIANAGIVTATAFHGDGSNLTGLASIGGATGVDFNDNVKIRLGTGNDFEIFHDGNETKLKATGSGNITLLAETPAGQPGKEIRLRNDTGVFGFGMDGNGELVPASNGSNGIGAASRKFTHVRASDFYGDTGNFTGDVVVGGGLTVGGVLTYEDVTNIDSVGIITARSGVDVDDFISVGSNIHLGNAGIVTAVNFVKTDGTTVGGAMTGYNNDPGENNVTTFIAVVVLEIIFNYKIVTVNQHMEMFSLEMVQVEVHRMDMITMFRLVLMLIIILEMDYII